MKMLDLYSGLGGASQPMVDYNWDVLRIDNNVLLSEILHTEIVDLRNWDSSAAARGTIDLVWASPPCLEFSQAYNAPKSMAKREGKNFKADLTLVKKAIEIIKNTEPKYWVIENVVGAIKDFNSLLGPPRQIIGPFALWGNFPYLVMPEGFSHSKSNNDKHSSNPLRANYKAVIPYPLADSLRRALEEQRSILDWV